MENQTSFDLKTAMGRWRQNFAQSSEFRAENLDELESHVHDSISDLQGRGLSDEESFVIATRRVGSGAALAAEFGRVNGQTLWIDRGLWMLVGWAVVSGFESIAMSAAMVTIIPQEVHLPLLVWMLPILVGAIFLRSVIRAEGGGPRLLGTLPGRPLALASTAVLVGASSLLLRTLALLFIYGDRMHRDMILATLMPLAKWLIAAIVILLLARKRLRLVKA